MRQAKARHASPTAMASPKQGHLGKSFCTKHNSYVQKRIVGLIHLAGTE